MAIPPPPTAASANGVRRARELLAEAFSEMEQVWQQPGQTCTDHISTGFSNLD